MDNKKSFIMIVICSVLSLLLTLVLCLTTDNIIGKIVFITIAVISSIFYICQEVTYYKQFVKGGK